MRLTFTQDHVHHDLSFKAGHTLHVSCLSVQGDSIDKVWTFAITGTAWERLVHLPTHVFTLSHSEFNKVAMAHLCKMMPFLQVQRKNGDLKHLFDTFVLGLPIMERAYAECQAKVAVLVG